MRSHYLSKHLGLASIVCFLIFLLAGTSVILASVPEQAEADDNSYPTVTYDANGGIAKPTSPPAQQEFTDPQASLVDWVQARPLV